MDVKLAFLNDDLNEEIYMSQLKGFIIPSQEHKACKLVKSLYSFKQGPERWHEKLDSTIVAYGCIVNNYDRCLYYKNVGDKFIILCLYID